MTNAAMRHQAPAAASRRCVLIMAGGTGGHVFPALATAECLRARGVTVEWLGTQRGIEARLVPAAQFPIHYIAMSGLRGKGLTGLFKAPLQLLMSLWQVIALLRRLDVGCVLGMGGFVSAPGGVAAWLTRRPLLIHEQNAVAGTANRWLSHLARCVMQAFPLGLGGAKARHTGNPVRAEIARVTAPEQRLANRQGAPRLLVLGGSLGAKAINEVLPAALRLLPQTLRPEVRHQCGVAHLDAVKAAYVSEQVGARVDAFIDDMAAAYAWADLVICRAGAMTVAELTAVGVPAILVPLPSAIDDHQTANARWLTQQQGGVLLPQATLTSAVLASMLTELLGDRPRLLAMAQAARALAKPQAADDVANACEEYLHG